MDHNISPRCLEQLNAFYCPRPLAEGNRTRGVVPNAEGKMFCSTEWLNINVFLPNFINILNIISVFISKFNRAAIFFTLFIAVDLQTFLHFLAHLSWKLSELFWSKFVRRPSSLSSLFVVNFSQFYLLKNHRANFNQTWHKVSLGKRDSRL